MFNPETMTYPKFEFGTFEIENGFETTVPFELSCLFFTSRRPGKALGTHSGVALGPTGLKMFFLNVAVFLQ
jgi:hypothetical protein